MTHAAAPVTFFGYWSGQLPAMAQLHFRSFVRRHPQSMYELWLDDDDASAVDVPELQWIASHPRIRIRRFSLNALVERHVTGAPVAARRHEGLRSLGRAVHRRLAPTWSRAKAWDHALFGLTYMHSSRLFAGFVRNATYRSDVARLLIPHEHYTSPSLYCDLDVCFTSDLTTLCGSTGFVYRWERQGFASNALLYLPGASWSATLLRKAVAIETFRSWILLSDATCAEVGLVVHPARMFDPMRDSASMLYGDPGHFFRPRDNLALDLHALAGERHLTIHWHGQWNAAPAATSIYAGLLKACEEPAA